jgi:hypothetical protein
MSAAVNQHATIEEAVFSVGAAARLYNEDITQLELEPSSGVGSCSMELRGSAVEGDLEEMARKELDYLKRTLCVLQKQ